MIAEDEDFCTTSRDIKSECEMVFDSIRLQNDFIIEEDGCSSKKDEKITDSDLDSDSAVSVINHLSGKAQKHDDNSPSRLSLQSDKSAIIRLNSELLKAKQSNWEVVDALTAAYDDIRDLRKREQRLNNILSGNLDNSASQSDPLESHKTTEIKILQTQLEIRGEELSKAKDNVRRLMGERDRLKEECSKARANLRLLTLQDKRKESEITIRENYLKSMKEELKEKEDMGLVLKENALNLEHQLRSTKNMRQKIDAENGILKDSLKQREEEISELKRKLKSLESEHDLVRSDLSLKTSELARMKSSDSADIFKEIENELAKELNTMELKLVEMKEKSQKDDQTIAEMKEKLKEWERMSNTMDEYINEVNSQQLEARKEISKYITNLEKELAHVKARQQQQQQQQPLEGGEESIDQIFDRNVPSSRPAARRKSTGKMLPVLRSPLQENVPSSSRKTSDSSLSGALESEGSSEDIGYYPSDVNESDVSRPSSSRKGTRRTLPLTPSDIEALCSDSPDEYYAKKLRKNKIKDICSREGPRAFSRAQNKQDSGLGESLLCREDERSGKAQSSYPWRKKSQEAKTKPDKTPRQGGEIVDESESFQTITPLTRDTGSPHSTAGESNASHKHMESNVTSSSPVKRRIQIPLRRFLSHDRVRAHRRHAALLLVFRYLSPLELCGLAQVCREWRSLSEHPSLWMHVSLVDTAVNNMTLLSISRRCKPLQSLFLKGLKKTTQCTRKRISSKADDFCYLEKGLEYILKVSAENMSSIHIEDCGNLLTDRCLLLTSSHCRNLQSFTYISDKFPACPEALWALWNCRNLTTLRVPPMIPNDHPKRFNDKSCETIANCWPALRNLSVGGPGITTTGLLHIAKGCLRLQELELEHTHHVTEETAYALCVTGLRGLQVLMLTFTTASPGAIKQFYAACPRLEVIAVHVGISDYFSDVTEQENIGKYKRIINKLEALREENSDLARVLRIKADYG